MIEKNLKSVIRDMLFWYARENRIIFLPFHAFLLLLWIMSCKLFLKKQITNRNERPVIAFTSIYFNGNARAVFEYMTEKFEGKYNCFWIARNITTYKHLRKLKKPVVYLYFPFVAPNLVANTSALVTNDSYLLFLFPNKPKTVQLWHGEGPKGITPSYEGCDAWCVPSEFIKERHFQLWKAPKEKLYVCGAPRLDTLNNYLMKSKESLLDELNIKDGKRIVLYAPTFDVGLWPWEDQYKGFEELCKFCKENNLILILRLHPLAKVSKMRIRRILKRYDDVYWLDMSIEPDTMKLLAVADILITDWSSIYTDFFLTGRPIVYMETEPDYYLKERGKSQVPPEFRAGEVSKNDREFFQALRNILKKGNRYSGKQKKLFEIIYGRVDGKASERVAKVIQQVIG